MTSLDVTPANPARWRSSTPSRHRACRSPLRVRAGSHFAMQHPAAGNVLTEGRGEPGWSDPARFLS